MPAKAPWQVVLLSLATLGLYFFWWAFKASKDTEDKFHPADPVHPPVRRFAVGVPLVWLVATAVWVFRERLPPEGLEPAFFISGALLLVVYGVALASGFVGLWRLWATLGREQRHRGEAPLDPWVAVGILLIPVLGLLVGGVYIIWKTQSVMDHLEVRQVTSS